MLKRIICGFAVTIALLCFSGRLPAAEEAGAVGASAHHAAAEKGGEEKTPPLLPPITGEESRETYYAAIWVIIIFVVMLAILYPTAWKNVLKGLKAREQRIRGDIAEAEAARAKAEATLREYNTQLATAEDKVRQMIERATNEGQQIAANIKSQAQADAQQIKERNEREIDEAKNRAVAELYDQAAMLATTVAEKILKRNLNAEDQRELINRSLEQLRTVGKN